MTTADLSALYSQLIEEAVAFSVDHVHNGGIPFTALVIAQDGVILGRGVNRVREHHDPTAHAEVEAIRDACRTHDTTHLPGTTLLASGGALRDVLYERALCGRRAGVLCR